MGHRYSALTMVAALGTLVIPASAVQAQVGFPGSLRQGSDNHTVPFRIGTAVTLQGGPSLYPPNGYQPGLLSRTFQDRTYQAIVRGQFNQIEAGNETKMMSLWTGGADRSSGHYIAKTNLFSASGPLTQLCTWAETQRIPLTVRGHCMVYYQDYTLPTFPAGQPPLFIKDATGKRILNTFYKQSDLRDLLQSYVQQVVDATMTQNAMSRHTYDYKVIQAWDVTNEVISEDAKDAELPGAGFAYRGDDPWYNNGPRGADGTPGYDYVNDIYRWAAQEMKRDIGRTIAGRKITADDQFELYYNEYNLEWKPSKMINTLAMIRHVRHGGGEVDGLGFQTHVLADGLNTKQFALDIEAAIANGLRFSFTEADCAIKDPPSGSTPPLDQQELNQGREFGELARLCVAHQKSCDCFQVWGATDDGSWLANQEATPVTRWVMDTRPGPTHGQTGYWPKEGQLDTQTKCNPKTGDLITDTGHDVSNAYDQIRAALTPR